MAGFGIEDPISAYFVIFLKDKYIKTTLNAVLGCSYSTRSSANNAYSISHPTIMTQLALTGAISCVKRGVWNISGLLS
jgi:hypothetical protein